MEATRTGTLTPFASDPIRVTLDIDATDNLPTRASLAPHVGRDDWYLDVPWDADGDDGSTRLSVHALDSDRLLATIILDGDDAPASEPATVTVDLPSTFWYDHHSRELPSGTLVRGLGRARPGYGYPRVRVMLDRAAYDELLDDARHYADPNGPRDFDGWLGMLASARATIRALERVTPPAKGV